GAGATYVREIRAPDETIGAGALMELPQALLGDRIRKAFEILRSLGEIGAFDPGVRLLGEVEEIVPLTECRLVVLSFVVPQTHVVDQPLDAREAPHGLVHGLHAKGREE